MRQIGVDEGKALKIYYCIDPSLSHIVIASSSQSHPNLLNISSSCNLLLTLPISIITIIDRSTDMIDTVRSSLSGLSPTTKQIILNLTMFLLLGLGLLFIFLSIRIDSPQAQSNSDYSTFLDSYHQKYRTQQAKYRKFAFYQTEDDLIFSQKQLDPSFKQGLNEFSNLTAEEFQEFYIIATAIARKKGYQEIAEFEDDYYYDWEKFMPPVKDMRDYDGSFIFAAVAEMEFEVNKQQVLLYRSRNQTLQEGANWITLSEQEVIDCCPSCLQKKRPLYVFKHMLDYGISRGDEYPYRSSVFNSKPNDCQSKGDLKEFKIKGWYRKVGCAALSDRLSKGPVVVWVDARQWRLYQGGILESCGSIRSHYALLVGRGIGYWKIRNSWGPLWGEHGHIRIKSGNTCGICGHSSYVDYQ